MKSRLFLIHTVILVHAALFSHAQEDWKLKLDEDGITVYTKPHTDSKIKALRVICTVKATLSQIAAVLMDVKSQDEWSYHLKSTLLLQVSPIEVYYYAELIFPFPFDNRDFVVHMKLYQNPDTRIVTIDVLNVPDYIGQKKGIVRVLNSSCKWVITPVGADSATIEFTLFADPGGFVPAWLINIFSSYGPFESFKKLRVQLKKPAYQNMHLSYITE
ncbi:MAG: START domain-containing protein [Bacteroidota bacterium]|nr:START domain-containing protein [Bacteroidota bacterium]